MPGLHMYTLNLERTAVAILENLGALPARWEACIHSSGRDHRAGIQQESSCRNAPPAGRSAVRRCKERRKRPTLHNACALPNILPHQRHTRAPAPQA